MGSGAFFALPYEELKALGLTERIIAPTSPCA